MGRVKCGNKGGNCCWKRNDFALLFATWWNNGPKVDVSFFLLLSFCSPTYILSLSIHPSIFFARVWFCFCYFTCTLLRVKVFCFVVCYFFHTFSISFPLYLGISFCSVTHLLFFFLFAIFMQLFSPIQNIADDLECHINEIRSRSHCLCICVANEREHE